jgi:intracellular sulfur oxidation DsrE/DsrF family protein
MSRNTNTLNPIRFAAVLLFAAGMLLAMVSQPAQAENGMAKVVYHADFSDPRRVSSMLTNINNMVMHYNNEFIDYDVRIVFLSHGIRFVTDDKLANTPFAEDKELAELRENLRGRLSTLASVHNVKLELCDITRTAVGLEEDKLYGSVTMVPSGVVRIAELQNREGFAYIKVE